VEFFGLVEKTEEITNKRIQENKNLEKLLLI